MSTIKEWLEDANLDFASGQIIIQETENGPPGWSNPVSASTDNEILTKEFDSGYGAPRCPRFIAEDTEALYFPMVQQGL